MEGFIRIVNYEDYQHYKDRNPPWVKQHKRFWNNSSISCERTSTRLLALFLISYASEFENALIPCNFREISRRANLNTAQVRTGVEALCQIGFLSLFASTTLASGKHSAKPLVTEEQSKEAKASLKKPRKRDELWDTLTVVLGFTPTNDAERGRWNKALKLLRQSGATPAQMHTRSAAFRRQYPKATLTATALASHWGALAATDSPDARRAARYEHLHKESA